ncbi:hypothetical protein BC939DRAFT_504082 [Gamsiella multidivaricata]|uniref:uncharacterized protein n=1 Tax=Gamsiella multidivaricata TaxID=101098 RepID=UPI00221E56A1|nr:uncharacterized protein BC939DRAFT_504082 [Gamsiella multidivaricata]KAG0369788.1 hypothetical protein BGZ54_008877 [Gamsiella multidivaricata]KAI7822043.1 hypothetical protein BC939DRAFT_504082 [Gamsiella multidivaricata]
MDSPSALEEEALAIVAIYGPSSFYALVSPALAQTKTPTPAESTPVYALKVSLEEPDFDYDPTTSSDDHPSQNTTTGDIIRSKKEFELRIYFPEGYPETNTSAPVHEIVSIYYGALRLTDAMMREIDLGLDRCYVPGEVVVFSWIDWLRDYLDELEARSGGAQGVDIHGLGTEVDQESSNDDEDGGEYGAPEGQKVTSDYFENDDDHHHHYHHHNQSSAQDLAGTEALSSSLASSLSLLDSPRIPRGTSAGAPVFNIRSGQPIIDRKSVFIAHLAPITMPAQVPWMIQQLKQENKKVVKATHNIMAFRVENENDNDDDGETAAGSRLLHLMSILDVKNVVVVVSRWYGGIPLSADRFKHINNAARQLLDECGYIKPAASAADATLSGPNKKGKSKKAGKR